MRQKQQQRSQSLSLFSFIQGIFSTLRLLSFLPCAFWCIFWCTSVQAQPINLKPARTVEWKEFLGVNAHFLWFSPAQYEQQMEMLGDLGLGWVRIDVHWYLHEPVKGTYRLSELDGVINATKAHKLKSVVYVVGSAQYVTSAPFFSSTPDQYPPKDPAQFAEFMALLAKRYSSVNAWQVWNEPNLPSYWRLWPSPEGYAQLLETTTQALRKVDANKPVVMAGMAYYSQMPISGALMLEALNRLNSMRLGTVIAYHPYSLYPEGDDPAARDFLLRAQEINRQLRSINAQKSTSVPEIWATEWGWSSYPGPQEEQPIIGADGQADYLLRRLALMSALDYDRIFLFALSDLDARATLRDQYYGLLDLKGNPKPAYRALRNFLSITGPKLIPAASLPQIQSTPSDFYSVAWQREDGNRLLLFWSAKGGNIRLPGIKKALLVDPLSGRQETLSGDNQGVKIAVKSTLQMLLWQPNA